MSNEPSDPVQRDVNLVSGVWNKILAVAYSIAASPYRRPAAGAVRFVAILGSFASLTMITTVQKFNFQQPSVNDTISLINTSSISWDNVESVFRGAFANGGVFTDQDAYQLYVTHTLALPISDASV